MQAFAIDSETVLLADETTAADGADAGRFERTWLPRGVSGCFPAVFADGGWRLLLGHGFSFGGARKAMDCAGRMGPFTQWPSTVHVSVHFCTIIVPFDRRCWGLPSNCYNNPKHRRRLPAPGHSMPGVA
jgi:hypothetical protein